MLNIYLKPQFSDYAPNGPKPRVSDTNTSSFRKYREYLPKKGLIFNFPNPLFVH